MIKSKYDKIKRKSITPVVALVFLVSLTVVAAGLVFFWFSTVQSSIFESTGSSIEGVPSGCSRLQIISVRGDGATVSNVGCDTIDSVSLVIDGVLNEADLVSPLSPGSATTISFSTLQDGEDHCVTVVLEGGEVVTECIYDCGF